MLNVAGPAGAGAPLTGPDKPPTGPDAPLMGPDTPPTGPDAPPTGPDAVVHAPLKHVQGEVMQSVPPVHEAPVLPTAQLPAVPTPPPLPLAGITSMHKPPWQVHDEVEHPRPPVQTVPVFEKVH